ncbi:MAG: aminoacyl--tRNA ligase-related protein [bacterium]
MKQSQLFTKATKELPKDETSFNAQTLIRAGFIDKLTAGAYSFLPLGLRVHNKICNVIREEMNAIGGQEILMPALTPKDVWEITDRWDNFDALFKFKGINGKEYALGATHEEVVTPAVKKYVLSYNDLPLAVYQIQTKFRNELRAKAGLIRGREFSMKDLYSFHTNETDLEEYYEKVKQAYFKIFTRLGLKDVYLVYASGGAFSNYSHEFQAWCETGEDLVYFCDQCQIGVNKEIIQDQDSCPECGSKNLVEHKAVEVGNIFKLGTRFSKPFELVYDNQEGQQRPVLMASYGIGPSRVMGTIVETLHDEHGIIWPDEVAPYKVHLISLNKNKEAEKLYHQLVADGVEVLYDDRDVNAGEKFAEADLIGCPYRLVISEKSLNAGGVEIKRRNKEEGKIIKIEEVKDNVQ